MCGVWVVVVGGMGKVVDEEGEDEVNREYGGDWGWLDE